MSASVPCRCNPKTRAGWWVRADHCNYSAFNGYQWTASDYSEVTCAACLGTWRTKAAYVKALPRAAPKI